MKIALTTDTHYGINPKTRKIHERFLEKLMKESFDVLVHTGDIASHKQDHLYKSLVMFRKYLKEIPMLFVLGNHCLWDKESWNNKNPNYNKRIPYERMKTTQREWFQELGVHYLQDGEFYFKDEVVFFGYDGWYKNLPPPSNDKYWMPKIAYNCPIDQYLNYRATKTLDKILLKAEQLKKEKPHLKLVCATHHSLTPYRGGFDMMGGDPKHLDFLSEYFDFILNGHSHQEVDIKHETTFGNNVYSCRVINAGSDYDKPKYKIIEIYR